MPRAALRPGLVVLIAATALFWSASALAAGGSRVWKDGQYGLSLTFPAGWKENKIELKQQRRGALGSFTKTLESGTRLWLSVTGSKAPPEASLDAYTAQSLDYIKRVLANLKEEREKKELSGLPAWEARLRYTLKESGKDIPIKALQYYFCRDGVQYNLTAHAREADFDANVKELRGIIGTLKFEKPPKK